MGIYGNAFDAFKVESISVEEAYDIYNTCMEELLEYYQDLDLDEEAVTEGANLEARKIFKQYKKDVKDLKKKYKADFKNDKNEAIKDLDKMNDLIDKAIKDIKDLDKDNVASTILGDIYAILSDVILFVAGVKVGGVIGGATIGATGSVNAGKAIAGAVGYTAGAITGTKLGKQLRHLLDNYKKFKNGKMTAAEYFNVYVGEIISTLEDAKRWNVGLKAGLKEQIKKEKEKD